MNDTPKIRFKGFTDDWEQRKFAKVFDGLQNNTLSRAELNYESGDVKNVHYGDVLIKFGDYIDASETELPYISDSSKVEKFRNSFLQDGDIVIADTAEDDTVGKCTEIQGSEGLKLLSGLHTIACRPKEKYGPKFLGYYINSPVYHNQLKPLMQGIKVTSISKSALQETDMFIPKSIDEQTKIGEYFSNLDSLITLHQRKYDKLINIKKSMLEKMFPKNEEKKPEIRFVGFTDDWEQCKLGDIVEEFYNGQTPYRQNKSYWDGNINWLSSGDLNRGIVTATMEKITEEGRNASRLKVVPKGTFVIAVMGLEAAGTRGNCGILGIDTTINQACMALLVDEKRFSSKFLFQWYRCFGDFFALKYCQGTKQQNYNAELLGDLDITYPSIEEQIKIGEYFSNLDNLITLHQRKVEKLQYIKESMLNKMFPN